MGEIEKVSKAVGNMAGSEFPNSTDVSAAFLTVLGKDEEEYFVSSLNSMKYLTTLVEVAESLGLKHEMKFLDCATIKLGRYFWVTNNVDGTLRLVTRYHEDTHLSPKFVRELVLSGFDLEFDGIFVYLSLAEPTSIKDSLIALKDLTTQFPCGFSDCVH